MNIIEKYFSRYSEDKLIKWFKQICFAEAVSWFFLFTAMIWIRYDREGLLPTIYIIIIGNIHGLFFTLYLLMILPMRKIYDWDDEDTVFALVSAFSALQLIAQGAQFGAGGWVFMASTTAGVLAARLWAQRIPQSWLQRGFALLVLLSMVLLLLKTFYPNVLGF